MKPLSCVKTIFGRQPFDNCNSSVNGHVTGVGMFTGLVKHRFRANVGWEVAILERNLEFPFGVSSTKVKPAVANRSERLQWCSAPDFVVKTEHLVDVSSVFSIHGEKGKAEVVQRKVFAIPLLTEAKMRRNTNQFTKKNPRCQSGGVRAGKPKYINKVSDTANGSPATKPRICVKTMLYANMC